MIAAEESDFAARDIAKLSRTKTQSWETQLLRVEIVLKRGFTKRVVQIYQTLPVIVETSTKAEVLK